MRLARSAAQTTRLDAYLLCLRVLAWIRAGCAPRRRRGIHVAVRVYARPGGRNAPASPSRRRGSCCRCRPCDAPAAEASAAAPAPCDPMQTPPVFRGTVPTSEQVLGFPLGSREVTAAEANAYVDAVDAASDRVVSGTFGTSWQGRQMRYTLVGDPAHVTPAGLAGCRTRSASCGIPRLRTGGGAAGSDDARRALADGERPRRRRERDRRRAARALRARRPRRLRGEADPRRTRSSGSSRPRIRTDARRRRARTPTGST